MSKNLKNNLEDLKSGNIIKDNVDNLALELKEGVELFQLQSQLEEADKIIKESKELLKKTFFDFNTLFENSSQSYLLLDKEYLIRNFNKTADTTCNIFFNKHLIIGNSIYDYIDSQVYSKFYDLLIKAFGSDSVNYEFSLEDSNGESTWFQINISPIVEEEGASINVVLISINNISSHANRSISILESITDGMFALDKNFRFTYVNAKAEKMIRKNREDLIGKNIWEAFNIKSDNIFYKNYQEAVTKKIDVHFEEYSYFMGGWLEVHGYPSKDGISIYFRSINERKEAEEKQKESEEWFKAVLATSRDGFAVELNERLIYMNNAFIDLFGYDRTDIENLKDVHVGQFYAEESKKDLWELAVKRSRGEQVPSIYESKGRKKDGSVIDLEISASVLNMKEKNYIIVLARDITLRKKAELQLIEQNEELLKINSELDRFVYSASHDLRAPLMSILGLINVAKIETKEKVNLEYLSLMTKSIHKLDKFVQDIIHYSRNSRLAVNYELIDFQNILKENFEEVKYLENSDKIEKIIKIEQRIPFFNDKSRICVILNNFISNAIRYYDPKKSEHFLKINISVNEENVHIEIEDNGIGIAPQHVPRIFDMFYRASETNVGSGLGLYIVKETILKLNGEIEAKSVFGEGSKFNIIIPNMASALSSLNII